MDNIKITDLTITREASATNHGTEGDVKYIAYGVDANGNEYRITWHTLDAWENKEDESDACDWHNPDSIELI